MRNKITKILMAFCFVFTCMSSITNDRNIISTMAKTGDNTKYFGGQESMFINDVADATNVSLLEKGSFYEGKQLNKDYIMSYSLERLLVNFKKTSGIPSDYQEYGGWAAYGVGQGNGEIELLSAYSFLYAEEKDPAVLEKINQFVDILYECQEAYALKDPANAGYLSSFEITEVDSIEKTAYAFWPIFYTFGKNLEGYFDAYYYAGNQKAYEIWYKLGKYLAVRASKYDDATHQRVLVKEYGDIAICFFQMYLLTGEEVFKEAAFKFIDENTFEKLYNHVDPFAYIHCNRSIPVVRTAIFAYLATNEEKYLTIAKNGFDIMTTHRCFANGNTSETEDLHPEHETDTKGFASAETCCAYNYMKVCDLLYRITNDVYYMDYYENLLYNQILASIDWDTGMKTYYISMDSGFYKVYHDVENSFWCCTCTGWENFAKFNQNIYYNNANSLIVNLFINSQIEDPNTGLGLKQYHDFPSTPVVEMEITKAANTNLKIRKPSWVAGDIEVSYNGKLIDVEVVDGYFTISKDFKVGDKIKVHFPMEFRLSRLDSITQPHSDAIMYGPLMMVGVIESIGEISPILTNAHIGPSYDNKVKDELFYNGDSIFDNVTRVGDNKYIIHANNQEVLIEPFYQCYREKYIVYWDIYKIGSDEYYDFINNSTIEESTTIDDIDVGDYFSETAHNYTSNNKTWIGNYATERNRGLILDGYMEYTMKVEKGCQNILAIKHFGTDVGYSYAIYIDGVKEAEASVEYIGKEMYWKTFTIPTKYTNNKDSIKVRIECIKGTLTTGIYEMKVERAGLNEYKKETINLETEQTKIIDTEDYLLDNIALTGNGNVKLEGSFDGTNYVEFYKGDVNVEIKKYQQYKKIKVTAIANSSFDMTLYGGVVTNVESINYSVANNDIYYPKQYAKVDILNQGSVDLRIDWASANLTRGNQEGQVELFNTSLKANYQISYKDLDDGLVLYYDFDEISNNKVIDKSGNGLDGTIVGDYSIEKAKYNNGIDLQGTSYVEIPKLSGIDNELTLSMWVKYNNTNKALFQRLFDLGNDNDNYLTTTATGYCAGKNNGTTYSVNQLIYTLKADTWYNVTLTVKDKLAISFVNGVEVSRSAQFNYKASNVCKYVSNYIGKSHIKYTPNLNGIIDEVRIYNYALSKDQVSGLAKVEDLSLNKFASNDFSYKEVVSEPIDITYKEEIKKEDKDITLITPTHKEEVKEETPTENKGCKSSSAGLIPGLAGLALLLKKRGKKND